MAAPAEPPPSKASQHARPPLWRNEVILKWVVQVAFLAAFVWLFWLVVTQAVSNLRATGISFSWDFLGEPPGIKLSEGFNTDPESSLEALAAGMVNMLRITWSGIIVATILGTVIGVSRLSANWIVSRVANGYIEFFRNIPLLVQIFFWQAIIIGVFPDLTPEREGAGWLIPSPKGLAVPWLTPLAGRWQYMALLLTGAFVTRWVYKHRTRLQEAQGRETRAFAWAAGALALFLAAGWFVHPVMGVLGWLFTSLAWILEAAPVLVFQILLAMLAAAAAVTYIRKHLNKHRTPAGLAKMTDEDYFRMGLAGAVGAAAALLLITGAGEALLSRVLGRTPFFDMNWGLAPLFDFLASRFDFSTGPPLQFTRPEVIVPTRFPQYSQEAGKAFSPGYLSIWTGVTLYTAAFIGELVRAGIMAVPKGQSEAAQALGLRSGRRMRLVVLPQAFRIILPPLGSQYLNLAKNTSLGIAVAYAEIVQVGQTIFNQTGQALAVFLIWMAFFSVVSLALSAVVNYYNRKLRLVER